jgi:hypothetical protein
MTRERGPKWTTFEDLLEGKTPVSLLNEPFDFTVDFAVEEPRESATERAMRIWFKQNPEDKCPPGS